MTAALLGVGRSALRALLDHAWLRRLVTVPAVLVALVLVATTVPLWAVVAAIASAWLPGRWRPLRLLCFALVWLVLESAALVVLGWLWLFHGAGRRLGSPAATEAHYRLLGWLLGRLTATARRLFAVRITVDDATLPTAPQPPRPRPDRRGPRPLVVLARHAGPGDSFLLVHELIAVYRRQPRIVLKDTLQLDPVVDILVNRLPSRFISPDPAAGSGVADEVGRLATGMDGDDALLVFPEGGNFTERRRQRAIAKLETSGRDAHAAAARRMRHLVAPRPGGVLAALEVVPDADVVLVAHTGLEELDSVADLWQGLPMDTEVRARFWTVRTEDLPADRDGRVTWLYDWWEHLDTWIGRRRGFGGSGPDPIRI